MQQGDIILIMFPFSNLKDYKVRPAILISGNNMAHLEDKWFCPITSKPGQGKIKLEGFVTRGHLDKESFAKPTVVATINQSRIIKQIGKIAPEKLAELIQKIKANLE